MRLVLILAIVVFAVLGAVVGALNSERIVIDLYFSSFHAPKGALLLCALLVGWLAGGAMVYLGLVLRLRRRLRRLMRETEHNDAAAAAVTTVPKIGPA